jgi:glycosyltransferase involved in cell wall biosynthesis
MKRYADVVLSHSEEAHIEGLNKPISVFHHPVEPYTPVMPVTPFSFDLLIWGTVNPYKGVDAFLQFNKDAPFLQAYKVLIAGKFASLEYYEAMLKLATPNVTIENKILSEEELAGLFSKSRYVLFTYNSESVLSSAALCKTLSYGKAIIGPAKGAFKELEAEGLVYNYTDFTDLEQLLNRLMREKSLVNEFRLQEYIRQYSWPSFAAFVANKLNGEESVRYAKAFAQT